MSGALSRGDRKPPLIAPAFLVAYGFHGGAPAPELHWANEGMRAILGYNASALGPGWLLDAVVAGDAAAVLDAHAQALRGMTVTLEARFRTAAGDVRQLRGELRRAAVDDAAGGGVAFWLDVTAEQAAREAAARREEAMWRARRVEIVAGLAGSIAHDCANLLTAIRAGCDLLAGELGESPHRGDLDAIARSADTAAALLRQLTSIGHTTSMQPRLISLDDLVGGFERVLHRLLGDAFRLRLDVGQAGFLHADPSSIEHVILSVLLDFREVAPDGARIALATERVALAAPERSAGGEIPAGLYAAITLDVPGVELDAEMVDARESRVALVAAMARHAGGYARTVPGDDGAMLQLLFRSCLVTTDPLRTPVGRRRGRRGSRERGDDEPSGGTAA